jgi:hypothetical protein
MLPHARDSQLQATVLRHGLLHCCGYLHRCKQPGRPWLATSPVLVSGIDRGCVATQEDPRLTATWKKTIRVAVSGAAGQISNHLLFMVQLLSRNGCTSACIFHPFD